MWNEYLHSVDFLGDLLIGHWLGPGHSIDHW